MRTVDPELRFGSHEAWWWRRDNLEGRVRGSLGDAVAEFWRHASLRGSCTNTRCHTACGPCGSAGHLTKAIPALVLAAALVAMNVRLLQSRPALQVNEHYPHASRRLPFPAVALCTNNIISKASLESYIQFLLSKKAYNRTYGIDSLQKNVLNFGAFVTKHLPEVDVLFMDLLQQKDLNFNVSELMYKLAPKCSSLLRACAWAGSLRNCSELFAKRVTALGYCCVFNSRYHIGDMLAQDLTASLIERYHRYLFFSPEDRDAAPWELQQLGQSSGLIVRYSDDEEDSVFLRRPATGIEVIIFDGDEYPLLETGVARLYPVQKNASMFFSLNLREIEATPELADYSERWRQCRIRAVHGQHTARSSYAWCLLHCRRRTIAALCNCVPFTLLPDDDDIICTPNHLPCLNKHKEKFMYLYPGNHAGPGLTEEIRDSMDCHGCLPDCDRLLYSANVASTSYAFSNAKKIFLGRTVASGTDLANSSVLRFYYSSYHQKRFVVEPSVRWYEGLATLSCQWVLLMTSSLVTFVELLFHVTVRWARHFRRRNAVKKSKTKLKNDINNGLDITHQRELLDVETVNDIDVPDPTHHHFYF